MSVQGRVVDAGGVRWFVQVAGEGPPLLVVHGAGASGDSFGALLPLLASTFTVFAPDLPGHARSRSALHFEPSLPSIAHALRALLLELQVSPTVVVGHSAGAAVLTRLVIDSALAPQTFIALAPALFPFQGVAGGVFPWLARLLASSRLAPRLIARQAHDPDFVERIIDSTGSRLSGARLEHYQRLARQPAHVAGVLAMLARWDVAPLFRQLPSLPGSLTVLAGAADRAVPLAQLRRVVDCVPRSHVQVVHGAGHLLHEERPEELARLIAVAASKGVKTE